MTWGEVQEFVSCRYEAERRANQARAVLATKQAELTIRYLSGDGKSIYVDEEFPGWWTDEERKELKIERLKAKLGYKKHA